MSKPPRARMLRCEDPDFTAFLASLRHAPDYENQIVHSQTIPPRSPRYAEPDAPLPEELREALSRQGVEHLYLHQARAIDLIRAGKNLVVVTGTASGKTLCYNLPVLESFLRGESASAFYLFPTKALAQDQLKALQRLASDIPLATGALKAGTYDGDTPRDARRKLRTDGSLILTNPDMLHQGILPYHTRWNRFFSRLRYVVVDEIHTYRGIFGSHVANVLRRLRRIARFHGADPVFICSSATIANPRELAQGLLGLPVEIVSEDGSPRGKKTFVLWNPPFIDDAHMERRSSNLEGHQLMARLIERGVQTITFTKARVVAELVLRYVRESLSRRRFPELAERVRAYRGGYLPQERRRIEQELFSGELLGVASTNALELGIDVGTLDASLLLGFPGTIASTWQQAGRAGRKTTESLVVLVAYNDPIDQYLMRHPDYFFGSSPEHAVIDPENSYILSGHLGAAAYELPLSDADADFFGADFHTKARALSAEKKLKHVDDRYYWSQTEFPARSVSLRTISNDTFTIIDRAGNRTVGVVDSISAPELVYPEGVYLHEGETYLVRELDLEQKVAFVERGDLDYYTQPILETAIHIRGESRSRVIPRAEAFFGQVTVTWRTSGFKKIQFYGRDSIGYGTLDLPAQNLDTRAMWLIPSDEALQRVRDQGENAIEGLSGIRNVLIAVLPFLAMCDRQDVGGVVDSGNTGRPTVFLYDRYPGGLGFSEKGFDLLERALKAALRLVKECPCDEGCPSCVGLPILRPAQHQDPDVRGGWPIPSKRAAVVILEELVRDLPQLEGPEEVETESPALGRSKQDAGRLAGRPAGVETKALEDDAKVRPATAIHPSALGAPLVDSSDQHTTSRRPETETRNDVVHAKPVTAPADKRHPEISAPPPPTSGPAAELGQVMIRRMAEVWEEGRELSTCFAETIRALGSEAGFEALRPEDVTALRDAGPQGILFFDLETTGFVGTPLFLGGLMSYDGEDFELRQFFARHYGEEEGVVRMICQEMRRHSCLVTFNGKTFDMPYLRERTVAHQLPSPPELHHLDLLHAARRRWGATLPDCRLTTLEWHVCRRRRAGDVGGWQIPALYHRFVHDGDPAPLQPIFHHNLLDLVTLAEILMALLHPSE